MTTRPLWDWTDGLLPPFDRATPAALERDIHAAAALRRDELRAIVADPRAPDVDNTLLALERCGAALRRVTALFQAVAAIMATPALRDVQTRVAPLLARLADEEAHDPALFARVEAVARSAETLPADEARLAVVVRDRMARRGAALGPEHRARLADINGRIAATQARFNQNLLAEEGQHAPVLNEAELDGLPSQAAEAAREAGMRIANTRPHVMAVLQFATERPLRERVWRMWTARGANAGAHDNRPVISDILRLRGEKARLLGFATYADYALADRMAATPARAERLLRGVWDAVMPATRARLAEMQRLADADGAGPLMPWDRLFQAERIRRGRFGLDAQAPRPYLRLECVLAAMFAAAGRLHGLTFTPLHGAPVLHPDVRVYLARRRERVIGALHFDLMARPDKPRGSWQMELQAAEPAMPAVSLIASSLDPAPAGAPVLMDWEYANVLFHEFGHALHMLMGEAPHRSLGSMATAWDMIELPALLNERWLLDRDLIRAHLTHAETAKPMPDAMIDAIEAGVRHDRVFSVTPDFIAACLVDLAIHRAADGRDVDPLAIEAETLRALDMPAAIDPTMRVPHFHHAFTDVYAAGVYSYLWADVMAADVAEAFLSAPGGLYDAEVAERWRDCVLTRGTTVPADAAFRAFAGRDPDPAALLRRFEPA